jgi:hypothetical protein
MNSLLKQIESSQDDSPEEYVRLFESVLSQMKSDSETELLMKKLQFLGIHFDPFSNEHSEECQQVMDNLGLTNHFQNPYLATNILLRLLDKTEEHLNKLKQ